MHDWKKILEEHEIAPRYIDCVFKKHPAIIPRWNELLDYAQQPEGNIFMSGPCGTGKTLTSVALFAAHAHLHGRGARFFNTETLFPSWLREVRGGHPGGLAMRLQDSPLLILDDIGQGDISDGFKRWLYSVINKRWEFERPTVVTTNLNSDEFNEMFGNAILSRLCDGRVWKFEGRDNRLT